MAENLTLDRQAMKDPATSYLRIYVGNLTDQANEDELYEHFIKFGQINGIVINRGFGFVQFDQESSAQAAIQKADGSVFQGKSINVRTAQSNADKARREAEVVVIESELPPAVALNDNLLHENADQDDYDNFGNYIGDTGYGMEDSTHEDTYEKHNEGFSGRGRRGQDGRGPMHGGRGRGRGRGGQGFGGPDRLPPPSRGDYRQDRGGDRGGDRGIDRGDRGGYDRYQAPLPEYPRALPVPDRNDCEIIVVSKSLTEYAEYIESRLKRLGIVVDLLYPMEDVPIGKVLGNIASRGCLYAILVMPPNQVHRSLTLTILHGLPQEHRNMPVEDALQLISRNYQEASRGGGGGREAVYALLGQLADGKTLTVAQYDKIITYLQERREQQVKIEVGEPVNTGGTTKTETDLQQRILSILNDKKVAPTQPPPPPPPRQPDQNKLLDDPTVRKALDSILQKFV